MNPNANRPTTTNTHYQTSLEQDKRLRSRIREERHAALCVLLDRELLTVQALAAQESIPQTRRRFLAKLLSPEDPDTAASLQGDRFVIQHPMRLGSVSGGGASRSGTASPAAAAAAGASPATPSGGDYDEDDRRLRIGVGIGGPITTTGLIVPRQVEEVYETDEAGWRRPPPGGGAERFGAGGGGGGSGTNRGSPAAAGSSVSSPAGRTKAGTTSNSSSVAATAGSTPDRQRRGIKGRSQRERERERGRARRGLVGGAGAAASIFGASLT
ncbi:hypothetical protein BO86DRAFT_153601 [Aspergillus japonicus CBS 114.51]|uniref:Uncharacterized protein n=2 Tax=Aspergillus TaxID=5052 RepID=A0A2V5H3M2_ASPV1|nr:hypothetical protein BO86DRAFT_153601 [Aspergillus japonicus CBS 114.51]PYI16502.1 hypothetical protein BO99DRAFT_218709 [Aspergillus violaceofuscus CBS 115571]RAH79381.1 hypothetical protein BO86DRAFT_153601 [Aspergillus japonicus CBS 114.51]